jgi:signal transduction histidine kinase
MPLRDTRLIPRSRGASVTQGGDDRTSGAIGVLVDFSRLLASAGDPSGVLDHLVATASAHLGVRAAAVVETGGVGPTRVVAVDGLPRALVGTTGEGDELDEALVRRLLEATDPPCAAARTYPLVSGGGLYGALILLDSDASDGASGFEELAVALTDLAAVALDKAFKEAELRRTLEELRESREALVRAERLKVLGEMAAVVTHEVRNPLAAMGGALQILEGRLASAPAERRIVRMVLDRLKALNSMITDLLSYARPKEPALAPIDLGALARDVVESVRSDPANAGVVLSVVGEGVRCRADLQQLSGVLLNLVINASQAMAGNGAITLTIGRVDGWAELTVADDGPGVPEELRARIFEPFFTTRGGGTGLGLAIARGVVERHGGRIDLVHPAGGGATFRIRLPA